MTSYLAYKAYVKLAKPSEEKQNRIADKLKWAFVFDIILSMALPIGLDFLPLSLGGRVACTIGAGSVIPFSWWILTKIAPRSFYERKLC